MPLEIRTTWPQMGMRTTPSRLEIIQPNGELQIKQQKVEMSIDRELPRVLIDQSSCFKELGVKNLVEMTQETAQLARQSVLEYIGKMTEEADRLGQIEYKGPVIAELSLERMEQLREFNIAFIPQSRPQFDVTGHLKINWGVREGHAEYQPHFPKISFQPGKLEIYMRRHAKLEMHYIDKKV